MPCALFSAFPNQFDQALFEVFLKAVTAGVVMMLMGIVLAKILFPEAKNAKTYYQQQFALIFNNASFLGYPLTLAVFGPESMVIYSGLMIVFNLALFSYGIWLFEKKITLKYIREIFLNPNIIAVLLGLFFFLESASLPNFMNQTIKQLAALTTPLSLLAVGLMLSQVKNLWYIFRKKIVLTTAILQLTLMPVLTYIVLWLLQMPEDIRQIFTMIQALPTATSLALFAEKYHGDPAEASEIVLASTMLSAVTLPLIMTAMSWL